MGQITTTQNLVAIKEVPHAGQQLLNTTEAIHYYSACTFGKHFLENGIFPSELIFDWFITSFWTEDRPNFNKYTPVPVLIVFEKETIV